MAGLGSAPHSRPSTLSTLSPPGTASTPEHPLSLQSIASPSPHPLAPPDPLSPQKSEFEFKL